MTLEANHTYRLAHTPPPCFQKSRNSKDVMVADQLAWRELLIEDAAPKQSPVVNSVRALCGANVYRCRTDEDCGSTKCLHYPDSEWGFCSNGTLP